MHLIAWDEVAHRRQEDEGIGPENEIATGIDEEDGREREDGGEHLKQKRKFIINIHEK